jgi:transposase
MMTAATTPVPPVPAPVAGIDIGKHWLDVHVDPADLDRRFENTKLGRRALRNWLRRHGAQAG